ncbi:MAG: hypothetical protein IPM45_01035 [Acidimicrobiales bacterium]|nr:hypothetical protein [Acidimicrobiales bacterium]
MTSLDRLHPAVVHHVVNTLGWSQLRPRQEVALGPVVDCLPWGLALRVVERRLDDRVNATVAMGEQLRA